MHHMCNSPITPYVDDTLFVWQPCISIILPFSDIVQTKQMFFNGVIAEFTQD